MCRAFDAWQSGIEYRTDFNLNIIIADSAKAEFLLSRA
jgi:hypothetical protein